MSDRSLTTAPPPEAIDVLDALPEGVRIAVRSVLDKKAFDVVVLFLGDAHAFTDHFVVCSARSARQAQAVVDEIRRRLRHSPDAPSHVEGYDRGEWVLVDCFDFVVHVFTPDTRRFYDLERLWGEAARIPLPETT